MLNMALVAGWGRGKEAEGAESLIKQQIKASPPPHGAERTPLAATQGSVPADSLCRPPVSHSGSASEPAVHAGQCSKRCMLGNAASSSLGDRLEFKSGSALLRRRPVLNLTWWPLRGRRRGWGRGPWRRVGGGRGGGWRRITCSVVADVPQDTSSDHSRGLWDK